MGEIFVLMHSLPTSCQNPDESTCFQKHSTFAGHAPKLECWQYLQGWLFQRPGNLCQCMLLAGKCEAKHIASKQGPACRPELTDVKCYVITVMYGQLLTGSDHGR